jgi:rifampicin phosphotransferase
MSTNDNGPIILSLNSLQSDLALVGGKGVSLDRLVSAGLPVPSGFHLTTVAYQRFIETNGLQTALEAATRASAADDAFASAEQAATTIQALFESGKVPDEIIRAIHHAYTGLDQGNAAVAVRSSATAEDLPGQSFAGQHDTFLNVRGEGAVLEAVRRCWASLWSARAISYRKRMGVDQRRVRMRVTLQRMVPAEIAGVLFTANPTSGERSEMVITASYGLGEAIVSGQITPDTFVLDRTTDTVNQTTLGAKEHMLVAAEGPGTSTQAVADSRRAASALTEPQLHELAALGQRVEEQFGGVPQDIEWALSEGRFWLLQSRPITHLPLAPLGDVRWEPPTPKSAWIRRQVVEHMPEPLSPLFDELYLTEGLERSMADMQTAMGVPRLVQDDLMDRPTFATVHGYAYQRGNIKMRWWTLPVVIPAMVIGVTKMLRNAGIVYWRDDGLPTYLAAVARWKPLDSVAASDTELLRGIRELAWADARYWFAATLAVGTAKVVDGLLERFLTVAARGRGLSSGLFMRGFPSKTLETQTELESIAETVSEDAALRSLIATTPAADLIETLAREPSGRPVVEAVQQYLDRCGHQIYSLDFAEPTQADAPLPVLVGLKNLVLRPGPGARARQAEMARERDRLLRETLKSFGPLRRALFRRLIRAAQHFGPYREEALFYLGAAWPSLRRMALELGRRFTAAGLLEAPDDVFFLQSRELEVASAARAAGQPRSNLAVLARDRRALREARKRLHPPPAVPMSFMFRLGPVDLSSRVGERRNQATDTTLRGFAVSPGRVTAPVSVIHSAADFGQMEAGTILVCATTTPAWTPLFAQASGLVTDIGGVLAHGSIVAREFGIPAVMGTGVATQRFVSGQTVTVDGNAGTVTPTGESP